MIPNKQVRREKRVAKTQTNNDKEKQADEMDDETHIKCTLDTGIN